MQVGQRFGYGRIGPPLIAAGCLILVALAAFPVSRARAVEIPDNAVERLTQGLTELLIDRHNVALPALEALASQRAYRITPDDGYWAGISDAILEHPSVQGALRTFVDRHLIGGEDWGRYVQLTQQLPQLADVFAAALVEAPGTRQPIPETVLRRLQHPTPAVQRALLNRIKADQGNGAEGLIQAVLQRPRLLASLRAEVISLLAPDTPGVTEQTRSFAFRFAVAVGEPVPLDRLRSALRGAQHGAKAALDHLVRGNTSPGELPSLADDLIGFAERDGTSAADAERAFRLAFQGRPDAAPKALERAFARNPDDWSGARGLALFAALAAGNSTRPLLLSRLDGIPIDDMMGAGRCRMIPAMLALDAANVPRAGLAQDFAGLLTDLASRDMKKEACDAAAIAAALDGFIETVTASGAVKSEDIARAYADAAAAPSDRAGRRGDIADDPNVRSVTAILRLAGRTRAVLSRDPERIRGLVSSRGAGELSILAAALVLALPDDHPALSALRAELRPAPNESLTDRVHQNEPMTVRILKLTQRATGWSDTDLAIAAGIAALHEASADAARAATGVLVTAGASGHLVTLFDQLTKSPPPAPEGPPSEMALRALAAFARAAETSPAPQQLFTQARTKWIASALTNDGLRESALRALERRPPSAPFVADHHIVDAALLRAVREPSGPRPVPLCLQAATLGPVTGPESALYVLAWQAEETYTAEPSWPTICLRWLSPSKDARLTPAGEVLVALADEGALKELESTLGPRVLLERLGDVWAVTGRFLVGSRIQRIIASHVTRIAPHTAYASIADQAALNAWLERLASDFPDQAGSVRWQALLRAAVLLLAAIPMALAVHMAAWGLLVAVYPYSLAIRSQFFYNPLIRTVLGLGYIGMILSVVPLLRRRLFQPFRQGLLGDLGRLAPNARTGAYFPRSEVAAVNRADLSREIREMEGTAVAGGIAPGHGIIDALARWRGPTCLLGPSGRGKTSYLRHILGDGHTPRFPFVYLRASECREGVIKAICDRLEGLGKDDKLIASLVHAGRFDVYIDGLNEVDREVQETIAKALVDHYAGNIFVATQEVGIPLPSRLRTYYLLPLTREQMVEFLAGREAVLEGDASITGEDFRERATAFITELIEAADGRVAQGAAAGTEPPDPIADPAERRRRELALGFLATLANPMDLETAAYLLARDVEPDPLRLQQQQFKLVEARYRDRVKRPFPIDAFARAVLDARKAQKPEIDPTLFGIEVAILEEHKQIRRVSVPLPDGQSAVEYQFRHDKIRDFYSHFALLDDAMAEERFALARDDRFAGVYDYLARELPPVEVDALKEYLLSVAVDDNDHRLSDRFLQHLRWRSLLVREDPVWLDSHDLPPARAALAAWTILSEEREEVESRMQEVRATVVAARAITRMLSADTDERLKVRWSP
ncbi:ATP-binding protein, partial [Azospirillum sp. B506]|uniref:ATP-binding protein n=1 Tax=Azospirillum sp. B506 TaxID=137721 RepID=UPI0005B2B74F